jgi:coenzyme F420-0:L-glutamate ligase / coenzyme F420-1:gamma-L-glutamate ligase
VTGGVLVGITVLPVTGIGEVRPGDDLADLIATAAPWLRDGDVLVVTSKIVSKAEGRLVDVPTGGPARDAALADIVATETARPVASRGATRIVQTHHGFVMASAGIDASNVDQSHMVLLPKDPDGSARELRAAIRRKYGHCVAVIISDTMGRPWRTGLTDVALGVAGIPPLRDYRGEHDPYGNEMHITQMAIVDELAGAAELVKGKFDQVPVAVVRGFPAHGAEPLPDGPGVAPLIRDAQLDLFSLGTAEARAEGLRAAARLLRPDDTGAGAVAPGPVHPGLAHAIERALTLVRDAAEPRTRFRLQPGATGHARVIECRHDATSPADAMRHGAAVHALRAALAAELVASTWLLPDPPDRPHSLLVVHLAPPDLGTA